MNDIMLELLRRCVAGESIKRVSPRKGGEYHSPCPSCGGNDRFIVFPDQPGGQLAQQHGVTGTWSCPRHCNTGGDAIVFCTTFLGMTFPEACAELGIALQEQDSAARRRYRPLRPITPPAHAWTPVEYAAPPDAWRTQATKLAEEAHQRLLESSDILTWLARRGLPLAAVQRYGLGYIEGEDKKTGTCIFRQRSAFGLPPKSRADGTVARAFRMPRGVTIPCWSDDTPRQALRVRIRRRNVDINFDDPKDHKFQLIPQPDYAHGPYSAPLALPPVGVNPALATWVVVEAELDAMAVHHACGGRVGAMSVLTVAGKPDKAGHAALAAAARILVCIDFEQNAAGQHHTADNWNWWQARYAQARLWPVPEGKDPGEAVARGVDLARWVALGMPQVPGLGPARSAASGSVQDMGQSMGQGTVQGVAQSVGVSRGESAAFEGKGDFSPAHLPPRPSCMPLPSYMPLEDIPADVLALARLWQGKPITFRTFRDAKGNCTGFEWDVERTWKRDHPHQWQQFNSLQDSSKPVWQWLSDHVDTTINAANFLYLLGGE